MDSVKLPSEYIAEALHLAAKGEKVKAHAVIQEGVRIYPDDHLILSYWGWLEATVTKDFKNGITSCHRAIGLFKPDTDNPKRVVCPILYLNLGRAYLAMDWHAGAICAFDQGLEYDPEHFELRRERHHLGIRKKPPLSFLTRDNPINKFLGILLSDKKRAEKNGAYPTWK